MTSWTTSPTAASGSREQVFLRQVGVWMALGLALTTGVAGWLMTQPQAMALFFEMSPKGGQSLAILGWVAMLAPLLLVLGMGTIARNASLPVVATLYLLIAACFGVTLAPIGLMYTPQSLLTTLGATIGAFAGFAAWGFFTSRSLAGVGRFAFMGLIGLIVLGFIQIFWPSSALNFLLGVGGVVVFTLLTAWDIQKIKAMAQDGNDQAAVWGALSLYLDFINLFLALLRLMGTRK
jgi:FtsH-binding integral membrane protein